MSGVTTISVTGFGDVSRPSPIPAGTYLFACEKVVAVDGNGEMLKDKNGHPCPYMNLKCLDEDPNCSGKTVRKYLSFNPDAMSFTRGFLEDLGVIDEDFEEDSIPLGDGLGKQIMLTVGIRKYLGEDRNDITSFAAVV